MIRFAAERGVTDGVLRKRVHLCVLCQCFLRLVLSIFFIDLLLLLLLYVLSAQGMLNLKENNLR